MLVTQQKQAAELLDVSPRTLRDWSALDGFPDCSSGYDIEAIREWREEHERKGSQQSETAKKLKLAISGEKLRQAQLQTRQMQIDLERKEGLLIPRKGVEQSAAVAMANLADWCEQFPDIAISQLPKKYQAKMRAIWKKLLDDGRRQLASQLRALSQDSPS